MKIVEKILEKIWEIVRNTQTTKCFLKKAKYEKDFAFFEKTETNFEGIFNDLCQIDEFIMRKGSLHPRPRQNIRVEKRP